MFKRALCLAALSACVLAVSGCETMGGNQTQTTIYDMHRRIVKLDKDLGDSITKLNETSASLNARVEGMDQQTRSLNTTIEDSNAKLSELAKEFNKFKADYYRLNGLTPGQTSTPSTLPNVKTSPVGIETSGGNVVPPPAAVAPAPAQTPVGGLAAAPVPAGQNELSGSAPLPTGEKAAPIAAPAVPQPSDAVAPAAAPAAAGDPKAIYGQAQKSYANNDWPTALKQFDDYLKQYPNSDQSANAQFWKAKCLLNTDKFADAVKAFESMRSTYPTSSKIPFAMHNQAVAHSRLGQTAEAERLMQAVIDQYPMSPVAEQAKADLKKLQGKQ